LGPGRGCFAFKNPAKKSARFSDQRWFEVLFRLVFLLLIVVVIIV
jgi:hypothetical protein